MQTRDPTINSASALGHRVREGGGVRLSWAQGLGDRGGAPVDRWLATLVTAQDDWQGFGRMVNRGVSHFYTG